MVAVEHIIEALTHLLFVKLPHVPPPDPEESLLNLLVATLRYNRYRLAPKAQYND